MTRLVAWWTPLRIIGAAAILAGIGLVTSPASYQNPAYRVLLEHMTARQAGAAWIVIGLCALTSRPWAVALLGSALIAWGCGFGIAALTSPRSGAPFGWVWNIGWGLVILRQLAHADPRRTV